MKIIQFIYRILKKKNFKLSQFEKCRLAITKWKFFNSANTFWKWSVCARVILVFLNHGSRILLSSFAPTSYVIFTTGIRLHSSRLQASRVLINRTFSRARCWFCVQICLNHWLANDIFLRILFMKITISNFTTSTSSPRFFSWIMTYL